MRGRSSLAMAAMLAMTAGIGVVGSEFPITRRRDDFPPLRGPRQEPDNRGRRAEKDAIALAKAEAKRQRKAAKRAGKVSGAATASAGLPGYAPAHDGE